MDGFQITDTALFEHRFWLQIMGDHSRFIYFSLASTELALLQRAQEFIIIFDQLLAQSHKQLSNVEFYELQRQAYEITYQLRDFKLHLLEMTLKCELKAHISSSFFNDMLNELDEYLLVMSTLIAGQMPLFHPIHYHMLWLMDAVGHAATVMADLDLVETDLIEEGCRFEVLFNDLNMKSILMNGYMRTQLSNFPSLDRLNEQAGNAISRFFEFLENIRDQRIDGKVLGTLMPLMADHMAREECYYLWKLSLTTKNIRRPDCDPGRPRIEI